MFDYMLLEMNIDRKISVMESYQIKLHEAFGCTRSFAASFASVLPCAPWPLQTHVIGVRLVSMCSTSPPADSGAPAESSPPQPTCVCLGLRPGPLRWLSGGDSWKWQPSIKGANFTIRNTHVT